jgi:hypothetical protein
MRMETANWVMGKFILKKQMELGEKRPRTDEESQAEEDN